MSRLSVRFSARLLMFLSLLGAPLLLTGAKGFPPRPSFSKAAILAAHSVRLGPGVQVLSGDVIVNNGRSNSPTLEPGFECDLEPGVTTSIGALVVADRLRVKSGAAINGTALFSTATVDGSIAVSISPVPGGFPIFTANGLPQFPNFTAGTTPVTVGLNGVQSLAPGNYGSITVAAHGKLIFTGGEYNVQSLSSGVYTHLLFQAPTTLRVAGRFLTGQGAIIGPDDSSSLPSRSLSAASVVVFVAGTDGTGGFVSPPTFLSSVAIGQRNVVDATFWAPNGTVYLQKNTDAEGAFWGRQVQVDNNVQIVGNSFFKNELPTAMAQRVILNEDAAPILVTLRGKTPTNDPLSFSIVTPPSHGVLGAVTLVNGTTASVTYDSSVDFYGLDSFVFKVDDGHGGAGTATVSITVNPVNDAPNFTANNPSVVNEDAGAQSIPNWATFSAGPANESAQTVAGYMVSNVSNSALFSTLPAIATSGTLTYTSAANAFGSSTFQVVVKDNGGTANGGVDTSAPKSFTITVNPVNDPPTVTPPAAYTAQANIGISVPDGATDLLDGSTITDVDGPGAAPFSITAGAFTSANGGSGAINVNGGFTYNPPAGFTGDDTFTYQICDSGVPGSACTFATATVAVNGPRVWFVNNALGAAGDGRLSAPFNTLAAADNAANTNGDRIFVFTGANTYTGGFGFLTNQRVIGQGVVDADFDMAVGIDSPVYSVARPAINGTRPTISGAINLAAGVTARGFNATNTGATGINGSGAAGLTINQVSVSTTNGIAVNLLNSSGSISFTAVSANGGVNGVVLTNTTGSFTVTGDTGASNNGSGGTIQNLTGDGIALANVQNIALDQMNIQNTGGSGVNGTQVLDFSFTNGVINNSGDALNESNIAFNGNGSLLGTNITGTLTLTGSTLTNAYYSGLDVQSDNGAVSNTVIMGNTITSSTSTATSKGTGVNLIGTGNSSTAFSLTKATISNNVISNFPSGAGIQVVIGNSDPAGPGATAGIPGSATNIISITGNLVRGQSTANRVGGSAIVIANAGGNPGSRTRTNFEILNNGTAAHPLTNMLGTAILIGNNGNSTMTGAINNNYIVANNAFGSQGVGGGNGVTVSNTDTPNLLLTVNGNTISQTDGNGILLVGRGVTGAAGLTIKNNAVAAPLNGVRPGIRVDAGNASSVDDAICLDIAGNTSAGSGGAQGIGLRKQGTTSSVNDFGIEGMAATSTPGVENFVNTQNPAGGGTLLMVAARGFSNCSTAP